MDNSCNFSDIDENPQNQNDQRIYTPMGFLRKYSGNQEINLDQKARLSQFEYYGIQNPSQMNLQGGEAKCLIKFDKDNQLIQGDDVQLDNQESIIFICVIGPQNADNGKFLDSILGVTNKFQKIKENGIYYYDKPYQSNEATMYFLTAINNNEEKCLNAISLMLSSYAVALCPKGIDQNNTQFLQIDHLFKDNYNYYLPPVLFALRDFVIQTKNEKGEFLNPDIFLDKILLENQNEQFKNIIRIFQKRDCLQFFPMHLDQQIYYESQDNYQSRLKYNSEIPQIDQNVILSQYKNDSKLQQSNIQQEKEQSLNLINSKNQKLILDQSVQEDNQNQKLILEQSAKEDNQIKKDQEYQQMKKIKQQSQIQIQPNQGDKDDDLQCDDVEYDKEQHDAALKIQQKYRLRKSVENKQETQQPVQNQNQEEDEDFENKEYDQEQHDAALKIQQKYRLKKSVENKQETQQETQKPAQNQNQEEDEDFENKEYDQEQHDAALKIQQKYRLKKSVENKQETQQIQKNNFVQQNQDEEDEDFANKEYDQEQHDAALKIQQKYRLKKSVENKQETQQAVQNQEDDEDFENKEYDQEQHDAAAKIQQKFRLKKQLQKQDDDSDKSLCFRYELNIQRLREKIVWNSFQKQIGYYSINQRTSNYLVKILIDQYNINQQFCISDIENKLNEYMAQYAIKEATEVFQELANKNQFLNYTEEEIFNHLLFFREQGFDKFNQLVMDKYNNNTQVYYDKLQQIFNEISDEKIKEVNINCLSQYEPEFQKQCEKVFKFIKVKFPSLQFKQQINFR